MGLGAGRCEEESWLVRREGFQFIAVPQPQRYRRAGVSAYRRTRRRRRSVPLCFFMRSIQSGTLRLHANLPSHRFDELDAGGSTECSHRKVAGPSVLQGSPDLSALNSERRRHKWPNSTDTRKRIPAGRGWPRLWLCHAVLLLLIPLLPVLAQEADTEAKELADRLPRLGSSAQVSLVTYTPGEELYQAFGHSAIRVRDDLLNIDRLYNFGVFDFGTPDFYLKFVHGDLLYQLAVTPGEEEIRMVGAYGQGVSELMLSLSQEQKQRLFEALEINLLPENRYYHYDFILDNCSTRPRDVLERITGSPILERGAGSQTFRQMLDPYFTRIPWIGFGISLLLGAKVDRLASPREACFLPADLERAVQTSENGDRSLTLEKGELFPPEGLPDSWPFLSPIWIFYGVGIAWFLLWLFRAKGHAIFPTALCLTIFGLTGTFLLIVSFWTRLWVLHENYNLLWLIPSHLIAGIWLFFPAKRRPVFLRWYLRFAFVAACTFLGCSFLLPQRFSPAVYPVLAILVWRCALEFAPGRARVRS
jgi:hypothetical protein